ncbi:MAG: hypothetical protein P1S60_13925, partial [Anaerolineae bacterium]|nr:hypothetical protein [Anaerolineae bacterium]
MMENLFILFMTAVPFVIGIGMGGYVILLRLRLDQLTHDTAINKLGFSTLTAAAFSAAALLFLGDVHPHIAVYWLPNTGPLTLHIADSGVTAALVTTLGAVIFALLKPS